ncbi:MarR family transcriptional regulator [Thermosulfidibacter takaii ABI70S6]|uniref:MarR family transcriptional regulator n=1 Tax=Thermosulfidibacter takaii (strain DSM 17441 / JCM 13301 / NBRC 103674 / ABI70S6) TaxID=1298851 RepID=A0A0S3QSA2_THET7|nr:MarR family transcriptional regulator [Thermosulfidibacter takaii]BAT71205.1 MarR family transcriptional regulator [Thermosulfidibacter takaii ABI70S6]
MEKTNEVVDNVLLGMRRIRPYFRKLFSYATDLSDAEILILSLLISTPKGKMPLSELQEKLLPIRASKLTNITNKLEDKGFIKKSRQKADRRKVIISITSRGKNVYSKFENAIRQVIEKNIGKITPEELDILEKSFGVWEKLLADI